MTTPPTTDDLRALVERLRAQASEGMSPANDLCDDAAAALSSLIEQEPLAWRLTGKLDGKFPGLDMLTFQRPDSVRTIEQYVVTPLYAAHRRAVPVEPKRPPFCLQKGCLAWHFDDGPDCPDKREPWCALYAAPRPAERVWTQDMIDAVRADADRLMQKVDAPRPAVPDGDHEVPAR